MALFDNCVLVCYNRASDCWRARAIGAYFIRMTRNSQCVCASLARHKNRQLVSILGLSVPLSHTKHMWPHNGVPKPAPNTAALPSIAVCDWLTAKHNNQSANIYQFYLAKAKSSDFSTRVESSHRSAKDKGPAALLSIYVNYS